jgi:hypothetical protein
MLNKIKPKQKLSYFTKRQSKSTSQSVNFALEDPQGEWMYSPTLSLTSALEERGWLRPIPGFFTSRKEIQYPIYSGCVDPKTGLDGCGKYRITGI